MVEHLCKTSAPITLHPPCCCINFDAHRVKKFIRQSRHAIYPMTSNHSNPRQNKCVYKPYSFASVTKKCKKCKRRLLKLVEQNILIHSVLCSAVFAWVTILIYVLLQNTSISFDLIKSMSSIVRYLSLILCASNISLYSFIKEWVKLICCINM